MEVWTADRQTDRESLRLNAYRFLNSELSQAHAPLSSAILRGKTWPCLTVSCRLYNKCHQSYLIKKENLFAGPPHNLDDAVIHQLFGMHSLFPVFLFFTTLVL